MIFLSKVIFYLMALCVSPNLPQEHDAACRSSQMIVRERPRKRCLTDIYMFYNTYCTGYRLDIVHIDIVFK